MSYDPEKYKVKREKVLGLSKGRGINFTTITIIASISFVLGLGTLTIPRIVNWVLTHNLDVVIYKLDTQESWSDDLLTHLSVIAGVKKAGVDKNGTRLVITFDRTACEVEKFVSFFNSRKMQVTLLNRLNHRQRMTTLKEEESFEAL